eukprot:CAMPEP_0196723952 /NCGR_PEP_ID=MMETSP1091-20130531/5993_1 /TAXON_ID=302021 /ORGANISM="Rhodomonas sp., Strain CCMP768" /LENGTH=518 /DNA_ID=CAMNT_0042066015 /DNA_START=28 /DNA_END=1584 /DNA_ORIENTATION=-
MATNNEGPGSQKPLQALTQRQGDEENSSQDCEKERMYWVDWCRSQSVWNVVCGHVWWTTRDTIRGFPANVYKTTLSDGSPSSWDEQTRLIEYTVDQGAFHTVPMFFLVSGYLTSCTMKTDTPGVLRFMKSRFLRTIPPFICGAVLFVAERAGRGRDGDLSADGIVLSHLWFLWALAILQVLCIPFCVLARMLVQQSIDPTRAALNAAIHAVVCVVFNVATGFLFLKDPHKQAWLAGMPVATFVSLLLLWAPGTQGAVRDGCAVLSTLWMALSTFVFTGYHSMCPVQEGGCSMYEWLSKNMTQALLLIILMYLTGFLANETAPHAQRVLRGAIANGLAVCTLLLSAIWPFFTYWGKEYLRRNGFTATYQAIPTDPIVPGQEGDPYFKGGLGPSWAVARMWFWIGAMLLFAKAYCNTPLVPWLHRHVTQSAVVLFITHRLFDGVIAEALCDADDDKVCTGVTNAGDMFWALLVMVFALSFAAYGVINSNFVTARLFGLLAVDAKKEEDAHDQARRGSQDV